MCPVIRDRNKPMAFSDTLPSPRESPEDSLELYHNAGR